MKKEFLIIAGVAKSEELLQNDDAKDSDTWADDMTFILMFLDISIDIVLSLERANVPGLCECSPFYEQVHGAGPIRFVMICLFCMRASPGPNQRKRGRLSGGIFVGSHALSHPYS